MNLAETITCQIANGRLQRQAGIRAETFREYRQPTTSFSWYSLRNDVLNCLLAFDGVIYHIEKLDLRIVWPLIGRFRVLQTSILIDNLVKLFIIFQFAKRDLLWAYIASLCVALVT